MMAPYRVLYLSQASPAVYEIIRERMPADFDLVTLDGGGEAERRAKIADCEAVIVASPLRRDLIEAGKVLRVVHHQGVGYQDMVDLASLRERRIPLALTPEGTTIPVAEHTVLLMLAACKLLPFADHELRQGRWHVNGLRPRSRALHGLTVGIVGAGRIGQAVAERLNGFGVTLLYSDPVPLPAAEEARLGLSRRALPALLAESDIVTLHLPLVEANEGLIGSAELSAMKKGAVIINTARGGIIDESALCDALESGHLGGAGLDVFEAEPQPADTRLSRLPNVVLTPHISAGTRDALSTKMAAIFANLERFFRGEPMHNEVDLSKA